MPIVSGGEIVLADTSSSAFTSALAPSGLQLSNAFPSYAAIFKRQLWVYVLVTKLAKAQARLPLKVFERNANSDRAEVRDHPYAKILRAPNPRHDAKFFWLWTASTREVYGEALWLKVRKQQGTPAQLWPLHPSNVTVKVENGNPTYVVYLNGVIGGQPSFVAPASDVVHFKTYNPDTMLRGLSFLEPLRQTLVNEDAIRRASSAFWSNGARPSAYLSHPNQISEPALKRLKAQWDEMHGGVDNFGKTAILEEGMEPHVLSMTAEDSQYVDSRRLNREECCAAADVPPPVVHILDRATFSNITEQMRSMYRDTMAPRLGLDESVLDHQLRPDFDGDVYAEFLLDEVLRGSFEDRQDAYQKADYLSMAEKRQMENKPYIPGTEQIFVNAATVPLSVPSYNTVAALIRAGFEPSSALEALGLPPMEHTGVLPVTVQPEDMPPTKNALDALWGRLGTYQTLDEIEPGVLTAGLNGHSDTVLSLLEEARAAGDSMAEFRARLRVGLAGKDHP